MLVIVNFGQVIDLERNGQFAYQFTVMDSAGKRVPIATNEETIRQLMQTCLQPGAATSGGNSHPQAQAARERFAEAASRVEDHLEDYEQDVGEVFGGDYYPEDVAASAAAALADEPVQEPVMGVVASQPVQPQQRAGGLGQGPRVRVDSDGFALPPTARTVPADEMGYPIVPGRPQQSNIPDDDGEDDGTQM